jgi:Ser/Thr protein kinase RdoA (MazF antagonist)
MLDVEAACRGKFIFDLATAVNAVCFTEGKYDLKRFESLISGYESVRTLSLAEWDAFPNELRFSALRFTVTRLREVLALPDAELGLAAITEERGAVVRAARRSRRGNADERARAARAFQEFFDRPSIPRRERDGAGTSRCCSRWRPGTTTASTQKVKAVEKKGTK